MRSGHVLVLSSTLLVFGHLARAQDAPAANPALTAAPAAPVAQPAAPAAAPVDGEPPAPPACYPPCREGFLCNAGVCVSACNPPCAAGQRCTGEAQCVADVAPPPPSYPIASYPPPGGPEPPPPPPSPGKHTHDGFLLRGTIGIGGAVMQESGSAIGDIDYTGAGYSLSLDVGSAVGGDFSVFGRFAMFSLANPRWESADTSDNLQDQNVTSILFGGGASYHLMPINMYFALAAGLGGVVISATEEDEGDNNGDSKLGFATNVDVGKEWWVAPQAGLGIALRFWFGTGGFESDSRNTTLDRTFIGGAVLFSLTYQ